MRIGAIGATARRSRIFWDPVKYIALNDRGWFLSIGGESRTPYEFFHNASFGSAPATPNGFLIQRYLLHTDIHLGPHVRVTRAGGLGTRW
jgi:hypothetical protein